MEREFDELRKRKAKNNLINLLFSIMFTYKIFSLPSFLGPDEKDYFKIIEGRINKVVNYFDYDKNGKIDKKSEIDSLCYILNIDRSFFDSRKGFGGLELNAYNILVKEGKIEPFQE